MALVKPTKSIAINSFANIMKCKCHAYISYGTLAVAEKPATQAALKSLLLTYFQPLGDLAKDPIEYGWKNDTEEVHAGKKCGVLNIEGMVKCINVNSTMIEILDEPGMNSLCTLLLYPFSNPATASSDTPQLAVIIRGVTIVDNGKGNGNNKYGEVTLEFNAQPDKIADAIWMLSLTS